MDPMYGLDWYHKMIHADNPMSTLNIALSITMTVTRNLANRSS